ncbi:TATA binding protein associated factor, partial [Aphelenchoides avenae]
MDAAAAQYAGPSSDVYSSVVEPPAKHPFRLLSQTVAISELDFREQSFRVRTELSLVPVRPGLKQISLHLGPACLLPSEQFPEAGRVTVNDLEAAYYRQSFELPLPEDAADRSVSNLKRTFRRAIDEHPGDLIIHIPHQLERYMADPAVVRVGIDVKVVAPKEGVKFVADFVDDQLEQGAHVFTYRSNILSSTPQWLPCVNLPDQLSLWQIEVTVSEDLMAICSGELVAIEKDNEAATEKTYHYQLLVPTSATNIGFAIGHFEPYAIPELPEITSFCLPGLLPLVRHTVSSMNRIFTFFEEMLSCRFPYPSYKQVFVDQASDEVTSFAGLSVLHVQMLYHKKILDVVMTTRQMLANAVSQQFFGCFVNAADFQNLWLVKALA